MLWLQLRLGSWEQLTVKASIKIGFTHCTIIYARHKDSERNIDTKTVKEIKTQRQ